MAGYGTPTAANPSPAVATGFYSDPANRGRPLSQIVGALPTYTNWQDAIAKTPGSDVEKTNYLRDVYGLGGSWKVQNGQLVSDDHSTRNGILGGLAVLGGTAALGALGGAGGAAAGTSAGLSTGASYAAPVSASAALGGAGVAGASGAAAGATGMAIPGLADILLKYGVPLAGNLIGTGMQVSAQNDSARLQTEYLNKALDAAKEEQQYQRGVATDARDYSRGQYANYLTRLQPYEAAGQTALERMQQALAGSAYQPNSGFTRKF